MLWYMAHEDFRSRSMLDRIFRTHCSILNKDNSEYDALKREYCLECMDACQRKQDWTLPAVIYLSGLFRNNSTHLLNEADQSLICLLAQNDFIYGLIKRISIYQQDAWDKTQGHVEVSTLVDGHFTLEESIRCHLDCLSCLLKKGNLSLGLKHGEELWDILITNERASAFGRELGFNWFIDCLECFNRESQIALFARRVSDLDTFNLCHIGNYEKCVQLRLKRLLFQQGIACFKLYSENCGHLRNLQHSTTSRDSNSLIHIRQGDITAENVSPSILYE